MRIDPNNLKNNHQVRLYKRAASLLKKGEKLAEKLKEIDQSEEDFNKVKGEVLVDSIRLVGDDDAPFGYYVRGAALSHSNEGSRLVYERADPSKTKAVRTETEESVELSVKQSRYGSPDTTKISLDKSTGVIEMQDYWLGFIPWKPQLS